MSFQKKNPKNLERNSALLFVTYKPAEIQRGKRLQIVFYYKHPINKKWLRVRLSVKKSNSKKEQNLLASRMVFNINEKLKNGWLPIYDDKETNEFKSFEYCANLFLNQSEKDVEKRIKRIDTLRSYKSHLSMLRKFISNDKFMMFDLKKSFIISFLDWIFYDRNNSPRTYNNYLSFINSFLNYCLERGFVKSNHASGILKKPKKPKIRQVFTSQIKELVRNLEHQNKAYYCLCMATYFCFIRRTELTKIKVKNICIKSNSIFLPGSITKNKKDGTVTIPKYFLPIIVDHIKNANKEDYLFSQNDFKTGIKKLAPKKISDTWTNFRKSNDISHIYQFYSLKDTGITDLLIQGIPAIKVRDQARHYDLSITEKYIARSTKSDKMIFNSNFNF